MINDLLKQLSYDDEAWEGEVTFPVLGDDVLLFIDASENKEPSQSQITKLTWLLENIQTVFPTVEQRVYEYYLDAFSKCRNSLGGYADELMPVLENSAGIWGVVSDPGIYIGPDSDGNEIQLEYECTFDMEHGLRVVILDNEITYVGI
jgi:hypothetical protein